MHGQGGIREKTTNDNTLTGNGSTTVPAKQVSAPLDLVIPMLTPQSRQKENKLNHRDLET